MVTPVSSTIVQLNGADFCIHTWKNNNTQSRALIVVFHGFLTHGQYPTVRYAAQLLASQNYTVVAPDMRGHGQSSGMPRGYLPGCSQLLKDALGIVKHAQATHSECDKCFLLGSSMGGTIALAVAQEMNSTIISGVALLAPMLKLKVSALEKHLLKTLTYILPNTWHLIPSTSTDVDKQYRDETKRQECKNDPQTVAGGKICLGSAWTCVDLADHVRFETVHVPILIMVADQDVVVDKQGSLDLFEQASSTDKTLKRYPALHGLLCEPSPLVDEIQKDLVEWIYSRS